MDFRRTKQYLALFFCANRNRASKGKTQKEKHLLHLAERKGQMSCEVAGLDLQIMVPRSIVPSRLQLNLNLLKPTLDPNQFDLLGSVALTNAATISAPPLGQISIDVNLNAITMEYIVNKNLRINRTHTAHSYLITDTLIEYIELGSL